VVRLDVALGVLGYRRVPGDGGRHTIEPAPGGPEAARRDGRFEDEALVEEVLDELAALFAEHGPEATAGAAGHVLGRAWSRRRGRAVRPVARLRTADGTVEPLALRRPYAGFFSVEEHRLRHRRFDGAMSPPIDRAVFVSGDAATVVPYDPRTDRLLLIEQFRPALVARRDPLPWCLEAVAGRCDGGEEPEATVRREAEEEAGLTLGRLERIAGYYTSPGVSTEFITAFVGEASLGADGEGVFGCASEDEDIRAFVVPRERAMAAVRDGEVNNAPLLLTLLWLDTHAERLRALWT
jgi:ADP-ribose pyrophosphatase